LNDAQIVPFGKYKGQPIEALANDRGYLDWLTAQAWFRERYAGMYTLIVNNFREPAETPEHNQMQARFLVPQLCFEVANRIDEFLPTARRCLDEADGWLKARRKAAENGKDIADTERDIQSLEADIQSLEAGIMPQSFKIHVEFEHRGWDVLACVQRPWVSELRCYLELKPCLGDDYPAVLRQMKALDRSYGKAAHVVGEFTATGVTPDQISAIFATANIAVLKISDLCPLPAATRSTPL
jgi:hypothetical protein